MSSYSNNTYIHTYIHCYVGRSRVFFNWCSHISLTFFSTKFSHLKSPDHSVYKIYLQFIPSRLYLLCPAIIISCLDITLVSFPMSLPLVNYFIYCPSYWRLIFLKFQYVYTTHLIQKPHQLPLSTCQCLKPHNNISNEGNLKVC